MMNVDLNLLRQDLEAYYDYCKENNCYSLTNHNDIDNVFDAGEIKAKSDSITYIFGTDILFWEQNSYDDPYDMVIFSYILEKGGEQKSIDVIANVEAYTYFRDKKEYVEYMLSLVEKWNELKTFLNK